MTPDQYARKIASELREAHQHLNNQGVSATFDRADHALSDASFTPSQERDFWSDVRRYMGDDLLLEKQSSSALLELMHVIQRQLAAREQKK